MEIFPSAYLMRQRRVTVISQKISWKVCFLLIFCSLNNWMERRRWKNLLSIAFSSPKSFDVTDWFTFCYWWHLMMLFENFCCEYYHAQIEIPICSPKRIDVLRFHQMKLFSSRWYSTKDCLNDDRTSMKNDDVKMMNVVMNCFQLPMAKKNSNEIWNFLATIDKIYSDSPLSTLV